jgi:hypothetical protein
MSRNRKHDFPNTWGTVFWIFCHQFVQKSGTAPRHTGDENGSLNERGLQGFGHSTPGPHHSQASFEQLSQMNPHQEPAHWVQIRLTLQAIR